MPRFVLLEHTWNGVHHDFMLESGEGLRTWAIDDPLEPGRPLRARALPVHRLYYLDYEGPISGDRGHVRRVDRGEYDLVAEDPVSVRLFVRGQRLGGVVELWREVSPPGSSGGWWFRFEKRD